MAASASGAGSLMKWPSAPSGSTDRPCVTDVRAMTAAGRGSAVAALSAASSAAVSCPSTSKAAQPKLSHFAAIGSRVVIDETGPST